MREFDKVHRYYDNFMKFFKLYKIDEIRQAIVFKGDEIVVDIGGGTGFLAQGLSETCNLIYVVDESEGMLSQVKVNSKIVPVIQNALNMTFESDSIDVVIIADVLHHIEQQEKLMKEVCRILKSDGRVVILDFEKNNFKTRLLIIFEYFLFGKLYFKTSKQVIELIKDNFSIKFIDKGYFFLIVGEKRCLIN